MYVFYYISEEWKMYKSLIRQNNLIEWAQLLAQLDTFFYPLGFGSESYLNSTPY